ncbi:Hypothetical predicted protein [Paramuricea clavata]|uniref:Uncharacterized protein n=1 Tax=Paramuricea clavata TaxID=317549 RepID=A0A7D9E4X1_PARCT|nr:Hypothetical predicted protein [Paramuricea clavata]
MWEGEINNGQIYSSQYVNHEQDTNFNLYMGPNGNNLQQFNTGDTLNHFLGQFENNALFAPQIMQHSRFQKCQEFYRVGRAEIINTNIVPQSQYGAVVSHQGNNIEVDQEAMFRSTGLPYGNIGITSYGQSDVFCNFDNIHAVKRKAEEDYSPLYCGTKRRITDEHMATGMNSLYITNDHNYCGSAAMFNPNDDLNMQFSTISDDDMQDNEGNIEDNVDREKRKERPVFHFTAPLEQMLKRKINILPPKIIQEMWERRVPHRKKMKWRMTTSYHR